MSPVQAQDRVPPLLGLCSGEDIVIERSDQAAYGGFHSNPSSPRGPDTFLQPSGKRQHAPSLRQTSETGFCEAPTGAIGVPHVLSTIQEEEHDAKQRSLDACCMLADFPLPLPESSDGPGDVKAVLVAVKEFANHVHKEVVQLHERLNGASRHFGEVSAELRLEMASLRRQEVRERTDMAASLFEELERQKVAFQKEIIHHMNSRDGAGASATHSLAPATTPAESATLTPSVVWEGPAAKRLARPELALPLPEVAQRRGGSFSVPPAEGGQRRGPFSLSLPPAESVQRKASFSLPPAEVGERREGSVSVPYGASNGVVPYDDERRDDEAPRVRRLFQSESESSLQQPTLPKLAGPPPPLLTPRQRRTCGLASLPVAVQSTDATAAKEVARTPRSGSAAIPTTLTSPRTIQRSRSFANVVPDDAASKEEEVVRALSAAAPTSLVSPRIIQKSRSLANVVPADVAFKEEEEVARALSAAAPTGLVSPRMIEGSRSLANVVPADVAFKEEEVARILPAAAPASLVSPRLLGRSQSPRFPERPLLTKPCSSSIVNAGGVGPLVANMGAWGASAPCEPLAQNLTWRR